MSFNVPLAAASLLAPAIIATATILPPTAEVVPVEYWNEHGLVRYMEAYEGGEIQASYNIEYYHSENHDDGMQVWWNDRRGLGWQDEGMSHVNPILGSMIALDMPLPNKPVAGWALVDSRGRAVIWETAKPSWGRADTIEVIVDASPKQQLRFEWLNDVDAEILRGTNVREAVSVLRESRGVQTSGTQLARRTLAKAEKVSVRLGLRCAVGVICGALGWAVELLDAQEANVGAEIYSDTEVMERLQNGTWGRDQMEKTPSDTIWEQFLQELNDDLIDAELKERLGPDDPFADVSVFNLIENHLDTLDLTPDQETRVIFNLTDTLVRVEQDVGRPLTMPEIAAIISEYDLASDVDLAPEPPVFGPPKIDKDTTPQTPMDKLLPKQYPDHQLEEIPPVRVPVAPPPIEQVDAKREAAIAVIQSLGWAESEALIETVMSNSQAFAEFGFNEFQLGFEQLNQGFDPIDIPFWEAPIGGWPQWSAPGFGDPIIS